MFCPKCVVENADDRQVCVSCSNDFRGYINQTAGEAQMSGFAIVAIVLGLLISMHAMDSRAEHTIPGSVKQAGDLVDWQAYEQAVIDKAVAAKTPVLIKFTADWCTNCKVVNTKVFKDQATADIIEAKGVLVIKGDTTRKGLPAEVALKEVFGIPGTVPTTILLLPDGSKEELTGLYKKEALTAILQKLPDAK